MACFKIYTHIQCIFIQITAIFYYVTEFVMVQICPTFDMLHLGPNNTKKYHKTFSCNFLGVSQHYDPTSMHTHICIYVRTHTPMPTYSITLTVTAKGFEHF